MTIKLTVCNFDGLYYHQYGVLVDNEDAEYTESDRFTVQTSQKHVYLQHIIVI